MKGGPGGKKRNSATSGKPEASDFPAGPVLPVPLFPGAVLTVAQGLRARVRCHLSETRSRAEPEAATSRDP